MVFYGYETWSLILKEEQRLKISEKRVLKKIFAPKRDDVIGDRTKLHTLELHNLYTSPKISRIIK
jgi:hypothetical protein